MLDRKNRLIITLESIVLLLLIIFAVVTYHDYKIKTINISDMDIDFGNKNFKYDFDSIAINKIAAREEIVIKGWLVEEYVNSKASDQICVILKNMETLQYYSIPTNRQYRKDVTAHFYDGTTYDDSGFEAKMLVTDDINPFDYEYRIYILFKNSSGKRIIDTHQRLDCESLETE